MQLVIGLCFFALFAVFLFILYRILPKSSPRDRRIRRRVTVIVLVWICVQGAIALSGFYQDTRQLPPRMALAVLPPLCAIVAVVAFPAARKWTDQMSVASLTGIHIVRLPLEILLHSLWLNAWIPKEMTFEGWNPDIITGITALIPVWLLVSYPGRFNRLVLIWHIAALVLVVNIVIISILATPGPLQQIAFDQPNRAILFFPLIWLPSVLVPVVIISHLIAIRQLWATAKR